MFLLCSNARSLHIAQASNCWVTLFTFAKSFEYMTAFCAFFTVCVRTPYNDGGGGKRGGGGRLDELKIQLSTEHSIDALLLRTFTGRYLNVRRIESKTRGNT